MNKTYMKNEKKDTSKFTRKKYTKILIIFFKGVSKPKGTKSL